MVQKVEQGEAVRGCADFVDDEVNYLARPDANVSESGAVVANLPENPSRDHGMSKKRAKLDKEKRSASEWDAFETQTVNVTCVGLVATCTRVVAFTSLSLDWKLKQKPGHVLLRMCSSVTRDISSTNLEREPPCVGRSLTNRQCGSNLISFFCLLCLLFRLCGLLCSSCLSHLVGHESPECCCCCKTDSNVTLL